MKTFLGLMLAAVAFVQADTLQQTSGKTLTGRVTGYENGTFLLLDAAQAAVKIPAATVLKIEFDAPGRDVVLETRTSGTVKGRLLRYEAGQFHLTTDAGQNRIVPGLMLLKATFGGGSSDPGKAVDNITGGDLEKHLVAGKVTIVDFYADWCGPCRSLGPKLEALVRSDEMLVLRKVNVDKNRALAAQQGVRGIPHIIVFDRAGKSVGTIVGADIEGVKRLVAKAKS